MVLYNKVKTSLKQRTMWKCGYLAGEARLKGGQCKMDIFSRERLAYKGVAYMPDWAAAEFGERK